MGLNYGNIEEMLDGNVAGIGISDDGTPIVVEVYGKDDDGYPIFKATWESKRNERVVWYVSHYYHRDGTVEELFSHEYL